MKLSEMSPVAQIGIFLGVGVLVTAGFYYGLDQQKIAANTQVQAQITKQKAENDKLKVYENQMPELERKLADLQQQLDIQKRIVPDEKEAPEFMHLMQEQAAATNVEIRRYTSMPPNAREYYTEVPFAMELDGSFYQVKKFFENVSKLERIINVGDLKMANVKQPSEAGAKGAYDYSPSESVVATCTATTFFSHEKSAEPTKPGAPARR